jgi:hypothetical protein
MLDVTGSGIVTFTHAGGQDQNTNGFFAGRSHAPKIVSKIPVESSKGSNALPGTHEKFFFAFQKNNDLLVQQIPHYVP